MGKMKQENEYWVDENNNRWGMEFYTEANAIKCSESLVRCRGCIDCEDCMDCDGVQNDIS